MTELTTPDYGKRVFLETSRQDYWWSQQLLMVAILAFSLGYATWAALQGEYFQVGPYTSPFYSPQLALDWWPISPALLIVWAPGGFRLTCYYFRRVYYRVLFFTPPACAVAAKPQNYKGERAMFIFQNLHRYFLYLALVLWGFHIHDTWLAFFFSDGFGVGVGSLVILLDTVLLTGFVFGCNSLRHLVGGNVDCFSCVSFGKQRFVLWKLVSRLNLHHWFWAWSSLIWIALTDLYIRLVAMNVITDMRIL